IDYGAGNLRSVHKAVETLNFPAQIVHRPFELETIDVLILPGVGSFGDCVANLRKQELWEPIRDWVRAGRPYLGICLGYQILFESSEESEGVEGLGVFEGSVVRFPKSDLKVPHMGWNEIAPVDSGDPLWKALPPHPHVYFVHSFYPQPGDPAIVASTADYGLSFAASVRKGNVVATQFHPEKSQKLGLQILGNFLESTSALPV
ncbi:MAG: imidazole glycerol phosphate synthase subunit HisH, partial [Verrucomicrobiota bacterium]